MKMGFPIVLEAFSFLFLLMLVTKAKAADFNVKKYGAKADGISDDTGAIASAWREACTSMAPSTLIIPSGKYIVGEVNFQGPCKASSVTINFQGTLEAPIDPREFKSQGSWGLFQNIDGLTVWGGGTLDGKGSIAWEQNDCANTENCNPLPTNLYLSNITNSKVQGITSLNSKYFHITISGCKNLTLQNLTIRAPSESPNTDGIHIGKSIGVNITGANIQTGDDCVSLGDGSQQINIEKVRCGPGHGISVGSLGKYPNEEPVMGIIVKNCSMSNTKNGLRIKTWPASSRGLASDLHFEDIVMHNVCRPIIIDQQYCPYGKCKAKVPSRVKISNISFKNIRGTSATRVAMKLGCSRLIPCQNVMIEDINLTFKGSGKTNATALSQCANVEVKVSGQVIPPACSIPYGN